VTDPSFVNRDSGFQYAAASRPSGKASEYWINRIRGVMDIKNKNGHDKNKKAGAACAGRFCCTDATVSSALANVGNALGDNSHLH